MFSENCQWFDVMSTQISGVELQLGIGPQQTQIYGVELQLGIGPCKTQVYGVELCHNKLLGPIVLNNVRQIKCVHIGRAHNIFGIFFTILLFWEQKQAAEEEEEEGTCNENPRNIEVSRKCEIIQEKIVSLTISLSLSLFYSLSVLGAHMQTATHHLSLSLKNQKLVVCSLKRSA